jgi:hypothetical protein
VSPYVTHLASFLSIASSQVESLVFFDISPALVRIISLDVRKRIYHVLRYLEDV